MRSVQFTDRPGSPEEHPLMELLTGKSVRSSMPNNYQYGKMCKAAHENVSRETFIRIHR